MKTQLWEGGIRVPMFVRLPGIVRPNSTTDAVSSALDFMPTVCELAGVEIPNREALDEGISLVPVLSGDAAPRKRTLFWEFHGQQRGGPPSGSLVIRDGDWKLHVYVDTAKRRLYNLRDDAGEQNDVFSEHPDVARRLDAMVLGWYAELPRQADPFQRTPTPETEAVANRIAG